MSEQPTLSTLIQQALNHSGDDDQALEESLRDLIAEGVTQALQENEARKDTGKAWEQSLHRLYPTTPQPNRTKVEEQQAIIDAAAAWGRGERWESNALYPSMDHQARARAQEKEQAQ